MTLTLTERFDALRDSGICSPTTRALLDDTQKAVTELVAKLDALYEPTDSGQYAELSGTDFYNRGLSDARDLIEELL